MEAIDISVIEQPALRLDDLVGLRDDEIADRRARGEVNRVDRRTSRSYGRIVMQNLFTFLNMLIFSVSGVLLVVGLYVDGLLAGMLGLTNALVAIIQEARAKRALDRIAVLTRPVATVIRDGEERTIDISDIVSDDLIIVRAGDQVAADGSVVLTANLSMDESLLTGESDYVRKAAGDTLYSGSFCMAGQAVYRVEKVGMESTAAQIGAQARSFRVIRTPLQREIIWLMRALLLLILLLAFLVLGTFSRVSIPEDTVMRDATRATAVLIGLVPQGLVLMITITYAMAIVRLAGRNVLIQKMNAVESLSHVDVLCLDKTGTITTNNLSVHDLIPLGAGVDALASQLGDFVASGSTGNRTSAAIGAACDGQPRTVWEEAVFSSERKWSGLIVDGRFGREAWVLGAPEVLLPSLDHDQTVDPAVIEQLAMQGYRVLLFAHCPGASFGDPYEPALPAGLTPLGLVTLADDLRGDARETIQQFASAGVTLKIISGDNTSTIAVLARRAGIDVQRDGAIVSGHELDGLDSDGYERVAREATIFGRTTPNQKAELIRALIRQGQYVAMVGDGVNDVPALKSAQVAIAMRSGSEVTRSSADIVLLDDAFTVLPSAVQEGQRIRTSLKNTMVLFLTRSGYTMLIVWATALTGGMFPVAFRHSVLVANLAVGLPSLALTIWSLPGRVERRVLPAVFDIVVPAAVTIGLAGLVVYHASMVVFDDVTVAQSTLTTLTIACGLALIPFLRPPADFWVGATELSGDWRPTVFAMAMFGIYLAVLATPPVRAFFEIDAAPVAAHLGIALIVPVWVLAIRRIWRRRYVTRMRRRLMAASRRVAPRAHGRVVRRISGS